MSKKIFGLIGRDISYSFSRNYFAEKFTKMHILDCEYVNFDISHISKISSIDLSKVKGLNVTIPYKKEIIQLLDRLDSAAAEIGAVNTIKIVDGKLIGYNTDVYGFQKSIEPLLTNQHQKALILGTGGAAEAVAYVLDKLNIPYVFVSRNSKEGAITYQELSKEVISSHQIIINCTPVGTFPNVGKAPQIPYEFVTESHLLYDLIYNPEETLFLKKGKERGAIIKNGYEMLVLQAEKSWKIWEN